MQSVSLLLHLTRPLEGAPTPEGLTEIISRVPAGSGSENKFFVGFYDGDALVAVMDLITGYPESDDAFIGLFLVDAALQRRGIGSQILADVRAAMKAQGYDYLSLRCPRDNAQAAAFWQSQGFAPTGEETQENGRTAITLARSI